MEKKVLIVGTGPMACAYVKVLQQMKLNCICVGRGEDSANNFEIETGIKPIVGGLAFYLANEKITPDTYVIVSSNTDNLMENLLMLLNAGVEKILLEKPGAISIDELLSNEEQLRNSKTVYVAYNRRFYSSVKEAQKLIEEDGGLKSMMFEFTEWSHIIEPLKKAPGIKENWFFANSTHVVDLAFHFAGLPAEWSAYSKSGNIKWHEKTNFAGSGITEKGVLFSYLSNWESAGRWGIELLTENRRIYLKPLELVSIQNKGTVKIEEHIFDDSFDKEFKPGLYKQVEAFLNNGADLLSILDHLKVAKNVYSKMLS